MRLRLSIVCVSLFSALYVQMPAHAQSAKQVEQTLGRLEAAKKEQKTVSKEVKQAESRLGKIRRDAVKLARDVQKSESALIKAENTLKSASLKRDKAVKLLEAHAESYRASVLTVLRLRALPSSMIFAEEDAQHSARLTTITMAKLEETLREKLGVLQESHIRFDKAQKAALEAKQVLVKRRKQLATEYTKLERQLNTREKAYKALQSRHQRLNKEVSKLAESAKSLQELLHKLDAEKRVQLSKHLNIRPIRRAKGTLHKPVAGTVIHKFGKRKNENETYRGMVLKSREGGTVLAPFDGEVAFSGEFREYGPMLLIRHSDGYISLLAGLGSVNVLVGTKVRAGEPVGKMGKSPTKLYVELRKARKPIDPAPWYAKL